MTPVAAFVETLTSCAADMALAGEDDDRVFAVLEQLRATLTRKMAPEIGADKAAFVADTVIAAVRGRRAEIESKGGGRA
jgi:hypothetical protein